MLADPDAHRDRDSDANPDRDTYTCARQLRQYRYDL
jgi:hypothetical protein